MPEGTVDTRCPVCERPVFDGCNVVRCSRCEALHHEPCWQKRSVCSGRASCKGKPLPVLVVRVPATVDVAELSAVAGKAAADHVADEALPRLEARVESRASTDELTAVRDAITARVGVLETALRDVIRSEGDKTRQEMERLRVQVEAASATVRALAAPGAALASTVTEAVDANLETRFKRLEARVDGLAEETRAGVEAAAQMLHAKLDEAHFALDRVHRPFPWDEAGNAETKRSQG